MLVKKKQKTPVVLLLIIFIIIFYYMLRVLTLVDANNGTWELEFFTIAFNDLYKINTPVTITSKNLVVAAGVSFFVFMIYETYRIQNKKNIQENTYGSAEWRTPQTELVSKNMKISGMNRHVILLGRPGTR